MEVPARIRRAWGWANNVSTAAWLVSVVVAFVIPTVVSFFTAFAWQWYVLMFAATLLIVAAVLARRQQQREAAVVSLGAPTVVQEPAAARVAEPRIRQPTPVPDALISGAVNTHALKKMLTTGRMLEKRVPTSYGLMPSKALLADYKSWKSTVEAELTNEPAWLRQFQSAPGSYVSLSLMTKESERLRNELRHRLRMLEGVLED